MVAVVHRYTQKTWAFLVGQRHRQTPEISQGNEGVQKVFGTLDLFVSLLETEIKYPILQGGILPFWTASSTIAFEISEYWRFSDLNGNSKRYLSFSNVGSKIIIIAKIPI